MVRLSTITTRGGDGGQTGLADGSRVGKNSLRIHAIGEVDEANSILGLAHLHQTATLAERIRAVQNDLFDLGADLATPIESGTETAAMASAQPLRILPSHIARLETEAADWNAKMPPLQSFLLPGGSLAAGWLHLARTTVRRAERVTVALAAVEAVNPQVLIYLNRLSDWLFILARLVNDEGKADPLWQPGKNR